MDTWLSSAYDASVSLQGCFYGQTYAVRPENLAGPQASGRTFRSAEFLLNLPDILGQDHRSVVKLFLKLPVYSAE